MAKLYGRAKIKVDGKELLSLPGATFDPGGIKRTTRAAANSIPGATEELVQSKIECELLIQAGTRLSDLNFDGAVINFECDTGQSYVVPEAWTTDTPQLSDTEGKIKLVIEGKPAEELV